MATDPIAKRLSEHPFLRGLTHDHVALLTGCALPAQFKAGQIIFRQGEKAKLFYLIEKGEIVLESKAKFGEPVVIDTMAPLGMPVVPLVKCSKAMYLRKSRGWQQIGSGTI